MMKNITEGTDYLLKFFKGHYADYNEIKREMCSHDYNNYNEYNDVKQGYIDIVDNISIYFLDVRIPEKYPSIDVFLDRFNEFKSLLKEKAKICEDINKKGYGYLLHVQGLNSMTREILEAMRVAQEYFDTKPELKDTTIIERILENFGEAARALQPEKRRKDKSTPRSTIIIKDEYDVQDLLYSILKIFYKDVRKEEPVPSFGSIKSRTDFYIPKEDLFIEVKITSKKLKDKEITRQLTLDASAYRKHEGCKKLIGFIYDPTYEIGNEDALKTALEQEKFSKIIVSH